MIKWSCQDSFFFLRIEDGELTQDIRNEWVLLLLWIMKKIDFKILAIRVLSNVLSNMKGPKD